MGNVSFSNTLMDCATECALRRQKRKCKKKFDSFSCGSCKFNIGNYIDADPRHINLFMLQAETRASKYRKSADGHHPIFVFLISACLILAFVFYKDEQKALEYFNERPNNIPTIQPIVQQTGNINVPDTVWSTLRLVSRDLNAGVDVDGDGLTNCIDAAVRFYHHFPYKDRVSIIVNYNSATNMHHLFNAVLYNDGVWRAIEPQAHWKGHQVYYMRDIWGSQYNSNMNRNVTQDYLRYVK